MKAKKRTFALILLLICVFTSACSPEKENAGAPLPSETGPSQGLESKGEIQGYIKTPIEGPEQTNIYSLSVYEDKLFAASDRMLMAYDGVALTEFYHMDGERIITDIDADANGIWLLETVFDGVTPEAAYSLVLLDFSGNELFKSDIRFILSYDPAWGEPLEIKALDRYCYIRFTNDAVACMDRGANSYTGLWNANALKADDSTHMRDLQKTRGGLFAELLTHEGLALTPVFLGEGETGEITIVPSDVDLIFDNPRQDALLCRKDTGLFLLSPGAEPEPVVIWSESGITNSFIQNAQPYGDGFVLQDEFALYLLEPGIVRPKTVLTLAALSPMTGMTVEKAIQQFNQLSEEYFVETEDLFAAYSSRQDAVNALNTRIIAGQGPDMIYFGGSSPIDYSSSGYLADIYELIDADPDLSRDDFLCLKAMETQGGLYTVTPDFLVNTFVGLSSVFGDRTGWTFDEYFSMEAGRSEDRPMVCNISPESFLEHSVMSYIPKAVDWESYTCDFDNEEFISIIKAAGRVKPADPALDMEYMTDTPEIFLTKDIYVMMYLCDMNSFVNAEKNVGQDLCFIGWPSPDGENTSCLIPMSSIGISAVSDKRGGAWEFVKYMITDPDIQDKAMAYMFPISKRAMDSMLYDMLHPFHELEGKEIIPAENGGFYADGEFYDMEYSTEPQITQKQIDKITALLNSMERNTATDRKILDIVLEEASAFFAGDRTAEDTARLIQSRVEIYVAEKK